jgi:hypothetical protein
VAIEITAIDETNTRIRTKELVDQLARHDRFGMIGLVGVQSNQFSRSLDIARPLRAAGIPVVISGSPVTGRLAIPPEIQNDLRQALDMGCSLFAGDAENGRLDTVILDAAKGSLQPVYDDVPALPALESVPSPFLPQEVLKRMIDHYAGFDPSRGCPFQCTFCTLVDTRGRKSRRHSVDDVEQSIRAHHRSSIPWFFITADNFAQSQDWDAIFDRIILLRERDRIELMLAIEVGPRCHEIPNFVAKAARAGVRKAFIGPKNVNPPSQLAAEKGETKTGDSRCIILAWKKAGVTVYPGCILDFPNKTGRSARKGGNEPMADAPEFFCYAAASSRIRRAIPLRGKRS